jgi:hypothetical protein
MKRQKTLLEPWQKRALYLSVLALWLSGMVWKLLSQTPLWMRIHGAAAMAFLIMFGTLLMGHVPAGWREDRQRFSGSSLISLCGILIVTGWILYYSGNETIRQWTSLVHWGIGVGLPILIYLHIRLARRLQKPY